MTGQPDFAHLVIDYVPDKWIVEFEVAEALSHELPQSRRLSRGLYASASARTWSRRLKPRWLRIGGYWYPRGGIPIDVFWQSGKPPSAIWIPDQGVAPYRGRG